MFEYFVGEIGIPRREFLYDIQFWEARRIIRGYGKRERGLWSALRWQTYNLMAAQVGSKGMNDAGIHRPTDLLPLPWDKGEEPSSLPDKETMAELQRELQYFSKQNGQ